MKTHVDDPNFLLEYQICPNKSTVQTTFTKFYAIFYPNSVDPDQLASNEAS